jgi:hypothetical protein
MRLAGFLNPCFYDLQFKTDCAGTPLIKEYFVLLFANFFDLVFMIKMNLIKSFFSLMLFLLLHGLNTICQVWTEPKNITNDSYNDSYPDICIDNDGILHCVWVKRFASDYRCIYYSKSTNQGYSWYPPYKISPYTTGVAHSPSINSDSLNNLYVIYKYDINQPYQENYYFTKFNGQNWSSPVTICNEYPGAFKDEVVMDEHDRLYIFWHGFEHTPFYKYYENGIWSEMINIYSNFNPNLYLEAAVSDAGNNLHCVGYVSQVPVYLYYNFATDEWYQPDPVGIQSHNDEYEDIAIDSQGNPCLVWHEQYFSEPGQNATVFRKKTGDSWGELELVKESFDELFMQNIEIVNGTSVIIESEYLGESSDMMLFRKDYTGSWFGNLIENYYRTEPWKVLHDNDYLYVLMLRQQAYGELLDVFITKAPLDSITTTIKEEKSSNEVIFTLSQNYPNPFIQETNICYELNFSGNVSLIIQDITGQEIMNRDLGFKNQGIFTVIWDGCNDQKKRLTPGMYYYTIIVNGRNLTRSLILVN